MTQTAKTKTTTKKRTKKQPKTLKTNVLFIIDESGSMSSVATDVRGGFNTYVEKLRGDGFEYSLTAIKFGTTVRPLFANLPLEQVPELTVENYMPLDSTALYDAIGYGLDEAKRQWATEKHPYGEERYLFIIQTDGFENASRKYTKEMIAERIKHREEAGNWTFVYIGADQNAWLAASGLGLAQGNVLSYASADSKGMFNNLATSTTATSGSTARSTHTFFGNP